MPKERKLTHAELKRKEAFELVSAEMLEKGYKRTDLTVNVVKANVLAVIVMLPLAALVTVIIFLANRDIDSSMDFLRYIVFLIGIIVLAVVHEGIHGLTWGSFAKNRFKSIEFGIIWSMLTPYCACTEPLKKWQYVLGSAMPTAVICTVLTVATIISGSGILYLLDLIMIIGGGGDAIIIVKCLRYKSAGEVLFYDHPSECGVVAFEKV